MTPATYPLEIYRGDSAHWQFRLWNDTGHTDPLDLTDAVPKAEIRDKPAGTILAVLDCLIELPNTIEVDLPADKSAALPIASAKWDLQITFPASGNVNTYVAGSVKITADITDSVQP